MELLTTVFYSCTTLYCKDIPLLSIMFSMLNECE
uniref:Uncharacterized protein n=1 Tax=Anguilla anguilla TaxID=7936 RepID=A0A0E9U606_ANGAN